MLRERPRDSRAGRRLSHRAGIVACFMRNSRIGVRMRRRRTKGRRYPRDAFDMIVESTDPEEVQRQVDHGWVVLDERQLDSAGRGPSAEDLIVGIEGLGVGGVLGYEKCETLTSYTIGYLKDDAHGEPVD